MCVHVFGGNSSPGCCNYAFLKRVIDNEVRYREEVSQTLLHNFYVDDLLKTVKTEELGIRLIRDVQTMCQTAGLKKFISNKKLVIQSAPEYVSRNGIKNANLNTSLPLKKARGFYWETEKDIFRFQIMLKDRPWSTTSMRYTAPS